MKNKIVILASIISLFSVLAGCGYMAATDELQQGIISSYMDRRSFLSVWGPPDRTYLIQGEKMYTAEFSSWITGGGASVIQKEKMYDVWEYKGKGTTLIFDGYYLVNWKTDKTTQELRSGIPLPDPMQQQQRY